MKPLSIAVILALCSIELLCQCFDTVNSYTFDYDDHSYTIVRENKLWEEAAECAVMTEGYLAEINDLEEQNALFSEVVNNAGITASNTTNQFGTSAVWIGGSDLLTEGMWIWDGDNDGIGDQFWDGGVNGSSVDDAYTNWGTSPPEPDNSGNQDKLTLTIASAHPNFGKWNDLASNPSNRLYFIIEHDKVLSSDNVLPIRSQLEIYPNPVRDILKINNESTLKVIQVDIYDSYGRKLYSENTSSELMSIDVSDLDRGIYLLHSYLENGDKSVNRFVK